MGKGVQHLGEGHRGRLRRRFLAQGLESFAPHEALELLLTLAVPRRDVKPQAKALLARFGGLKEVLDAPAGELARVAGVGAVAAAGLKVVREAAGLYLRQKAQGRESFADPAALEDYWRLRLGGLAHEEFHVAYLDSGHCLLKDGVEALERGTLDRAVVFPRKVMESALKRGAAALVLAHNHPSGEARASEQDKSLTRALCAAAQTLQMRVLDHVIVAGDSVFSFRRAGLL